MPKALNRQTCSSHNRETEGPAGFVGRTDSCDQSVCAFGRLARRLFGGEAAGTEGVIERDDVIHIRSRRAATTAMFRRGA